jgi:predicted ester cyclase
MTPAGEVPPTGRSIELKVAEFFELRNGKVRRIRTYFDQGAVMREFGLTEATEPAHAKA